MPVADPEIRDLALIGDRRTAAVVARDGSVVWYCPERFDQPSLLAALLDRDKGGSWTVRLPGVQPGGRRYLEDSGVLETTLRTDAGDFSVTDWMPLGESTPSGICRLFSRAPDAVAVSLAAAPDYNRRALLIEQRDGVVCIDGKHRLYASHALEVEDGVVRLHLRAGEEGWIVLADAPVEKPGGRDVRRWLDITLSTWRRLASQIVYDGPFERQVAQSLRALRLLTYAPNGGIVAAATTSLPELPGGDRNYDYRYVWLRDTGMIVSALVRAGSAAEEATAFLDFICGSIQADAASPLLPPFLSLDFTPAPDESYLDFSGYAASRPVRVGNNANGQLQLDGFANVLLAAKLIYRRQHTRQHWATVAQIADYLAGHWRDPDYGIWEEHRPQQYTAGKVITSCGLRYIAEYATDETQARRWRDAAKQIDAYVAGHCINSEGAYSAIAGGEAVDVSAVLFPIWGYTAADSPQMLATMHVLERDYSDGHLYWRHLEEIDRGREGAFLAATIWVAQYWVMRKDLARAREILETALMYSNDLGFFSEEADAHSNAMLGNFPQTFVHAAFIGAVIDYRNAVSGSVVCD